MIWCVVNLVLLPQRSTMNKIIFYLAAILITSPTFAKSNLINCEEILNTIQQKNETSEFLAKSLLLNCEIGHEESCSCIANSGFTEDFEDLDLNQIERDNFIAVPLTFIC